MSRCSPSFTKKRSTKPKCNLRDLAGVDSDSEVTGFAIDHRKVAKGSVFGAFKGAVFNGEDFIGEAVERGAVAVVARAEASVPTVPHLGGRRAAAAVRPARIEILRALSGDGRRGHRDQRQDLDRRDDAPAVAHGGASLGVDRHAWGHDVRRPGEDRADDARHRHLPQQYGGPQAHGHQPCRLRGVVARARPASRRGRAAEGRRLHQLQPRPPRLPPVDGRLFRSQDAAVRRASSGGRRGGRSGPTIPSRRRSSSASASAASSR